MTDFEQGITSQTAEVGIIPERSIVSKVLGTAELLRDNTVDAFVNAKDTSYNVLQKAWYTHTAALFFLEYAALKTLSLVDPNFKDTLIKLSNAFASAGVVTLLEDALRGSKTKFPAGEHMNIEVLRFKTMQGKQLSDGTKIEPGARIGWISFTRNIPALDEKENLIGFARKLFKSGEDSLRELAALCESGDPRLNGVEGFYGFSHLAGPLAERFGFDVFEMSDPLRLHYWLGKRHVLKVAKNNENWKKLAQNYKSPRRLLFQDKN